MMTEATEPSCNVLTLCHDRAKILGFYNQDSMRYRLPMRYYDSISPALDQALANYYPTTTPRKRPVHYVDQTESIRLLVQDYDGRLWLDGDASHLSLSALRDWCVQMKPRGVASTSEPLSDFLQDVVGKDGWSVNFHYTVTAENFREHIPHEVFRVSQADRPELEAFLDRPADTPFLTIRRANINLARDLEWMYQGLPLECYAVRSGSDITGLCTVYQITPLCDEISRLYVPPAFRGQGYGQSLLSVATQRILSLGRQPGFAVGGDPEKLRRFLVHLGFEMTNRFWHWRYWWDVAEPGKLMGSK